MGLENKLFQMLLKGSEVSAIVDDWVERNIECDLRLRKAKTKGHVVIETKDVLFARNIQICHPSCQVNIKDLNNLKEKKE